MKLLLTSNGFMGTSLEKDFSDLVGSRKNLKVAIIPTAGDPIEWVPEHDGDEEKFYIAKLVPEKLGQHMEWLRSYQKEWEKKGYSVVMADLKEDPVELRKKLESVDIIDVIGGDANWLLDWGKKSKLDTYLKDILDKGVVYVGASAGDGLLIPDIGLTWWEPEWKEDHIGFGIVDFVVVVHQKESDTEKSVESLMKRKEYMQTLGEFPWRVYLVQDGQAIKVDGEKVEHVGPGAKKYI